MTEAEWLTGTDGRHLLVVQEYASIRKMLLIAAAFVRQLQSDPDSAEGKPCDDLLEAIADHPRPWYEIEERYLGRGRGTGGSRTSFTQRYPARSPGSHVRGCWAVDRVLEKE